MDTLKLAARFCQVAWVVDDIRRAEAFFTATTQTGGFLKMEGLTAANRDGVFHIGEPGELVYDLYVGYSGETQIELIRPVSSNNIFRAWLDRHGPGVHHIAYWLDESEREAAFAQMLASGFPLLQRFRSPMLEVGFFDTRAAIGVYTEIVGANSDGHDFLAALKSGRLSLPEEVNAT